MGTVTRRQMSKAYLGLQSVLSTVNGSRARKVGAAMRVLDNLHAEMRRAAIFAAGAKARKPVPRFERRLLGSTESCTFYDGYASVHKGFVNPYRSPPGFDDRDEATYR